MALIAAALVLAGAGNSLEDDLCAIARQAELPGLGVAVVTSGGMEWSFYYGVKKSGEDSKVDGSTRWHLGSCTKAMTAAVVCGLAEEGKVDLSAPLAKDFPEVKVDSGYRDVTLRHLLAHQSGMVPNVNWSSFKGGLAEARLAAVRQLLVTPPASEVGKFTYSNAEVVVAGAAAERVMGKSIENLLTAEYAKIGIRDFGFGPTRKGETWPHIEGKPVAGNYDNAPVMTAAGRANMTLPDWGKWISEILKGLEGKETVLPESYFREIIKPPLGGNYAMGWVLDSRPWADGACYWHNGSNTMNYCVVWVAPNKDRAVLVVTNTGGSKVGKAADDCVAAVIKSLK
ncbi:MAG: serine hydrolase domain-containing protein [Fimbriimonadaceae bacterium]